MTKLFPEKIYWATLTQRKGGNVNTYIIKEETGKNVQCEKRVWVCQR